MLSKISSRKEDSMIEKFLPGLIFLLRLNDYMFGRIMHIKKAVVKILLQECQPHGTVAGAQ